MPGLRLPPAVLNMYAKNIVGASRRPCHLNNATRDVNDNTGRRGRRPLRWFFAYISVIYGTPRTPSPTVFLRISVLRNAEGGVPYGGAFCLYIRDLRNAEARLPFQATDKKCKDGPKGAPPTMGLFARFNKKITFFGRKIALAIDDLKWYNIRYRIF